MRTTLISLAALAAALLPAGTAAADPPVQTTASFTISTPVANFSCRPYGYEFEALSTFSVTRRSTLFYDDAGTLVREIRHVTFAGTLYRSDDLSATIPYAGRSTSTFDPALSTVTITGLFRYSHPDGSGLVTLSAGRRINDAATAEAIIESGRVYADWAAGACAYLAE